MKALLTLFKQKLLVIGLLLTCTSMYSQDGASTKSSVKLKMSSFLTNKMTYDIYKPPTVDRMQSVFTFKGDLKDIMKGQAYFIVSKEKDINNLDDCFIRVITTRFYPDKENDFTSRKAMLSYDYFKRFRGINRSKTSGGYISLNMETDTSKKLTAGTYYHYVLLYTYVWSTGTWRYFLLTENIRSTFTIKKSSIPPVPDPAPDPDPNPEPESNIDISFADFTIYNSVNYPNNTITATVKARNIGNTRVENVTGKFYISDKSAYENNYNTISCGSQSLGSLSAGEERNFSVNISLPSDGILNSYFPNKTNLYLLGYLESVINEKNTKDNSKAISITIIH